MFSIFTIDRLTDKWPYIQTNGQIDGQTNRQTKGLMDELIAGQTDRKTNGPTDRKTDRQTRILKELDVLISS